MEKAELNAIIFCKRPGPIIAYKKKNLGSREKCAMDGEFLQWDFFIPYIIDVMIN